METGERRSLTLIRRFGIAGSLLLATGSLGAGAAPVLNPVHEIAVLRLFSRATTVSLALAFAGMGIMVAAWLLLGRFTRPGRPTTASQAQVIGTLACWSVPLLLVPPLFSRDAYVYLAQSEIVRRGMDPYTLGPAAALGVDDPFTMGVSNVWRDTPAPYGPLFLTIGSWLNSVSGGSVILGVLAHRVLALIGIGLIVWALPRLASRFGVPPVTALWLGVANPLVLFHLVAGVHNEAIAIGLMLTGIAVGLARLPVRVSGDRPPPLRNGELAGLLIGAVLISLAATIKIQAAVALGFYGVMIARRWHGRLRDLARAALALTVVFVTVVVTVSLATGLGFGWFESLSTPARIRTWLSPVSQLANLGGLLGAHLGLGDHTDALASVLATLGVLVAGALTVKLLLDSFRWRLRPVIGLGIAMAAIVTLHVSLHPWWLLWAVVPLAAAAATARFRVVAAAGSAAMAMVIPPTGSTFDGREYVLSQAYLAAAVVIVIALLLLARAVPILPKTALQPLAQRSRGEPAP
ncbi:hypothetical protein F8178_12110 [Haloechinothrix sp. LS1_15]|nr:hypothetical protein [Haloechinothrix sp. LS1_15]